MQIVAAWRGGVARSFSPGASREPSGRGAWRLRYRSWSTPAARTPWAGCSAMSGRQPCWRRRRWQWIG